MARTATREGVPLARAAVLRGYSLGREEVRRGVARRGIEPRASARFGGVHDAQANLLARNLVRRLEELPVVLGRRAEDLFRKVTLQVVSARTLGVEREDRPSVQREVAATLREAGARAFVDRAGREWNLDIYAEMATRTTLREAASLATALETYDQGFDLVDVLGESAFPDSPCVPFEGTQLSLTGQTEGFVTLEEARAEGFQHPNCFIGSTLLRTSEGILPIREIREGATVYSVTGVREEVRSKMVRDYVGDLVTICAGGFQVSGTPDHPALTDTGWKPLGLLRKSDRLPDNREAIGRRGVEGVMVDAEDPEPGFLEGLVAETILRGARAVAMRPAVDLHDQVGGEYEIHDVAADRLLELERDPLALRPFQDQRLARVGIRPESIREFLGAYFTDLGEVGVSPVLDEVVDRATRRDPVFSEEEERRGSGSVAEASSDFPHGLLLFDVDPAQGGLDLASILLRAATSRMLHCESIYTGHGEGKVYDLETRGSFVLAGGIGAHNCIHDLAPVVSTRSRLPEGEVSVDGMRDLARRLVKVRTRR